MKGILGRKAGMTQIIKENGEVVPVTVIEAGPCYVVQLRTEAENGYRAVQLGYEEVPAKRLTRGEQGHLRQAGAELPLLRHLREVPMSSQETYEVGQKILVDIFQPGERVDIEGVTKGRGFAGVVKRHGFKGQRHTHGASDRERHPGSNSSTTTPGRVYKGKRMAGHMGAARMTAMNLEVVLVDPERNLLAVKGSVPGANGGLVLVKYARKQKVAKGGK